MKIRAMAAEAQGNSLRPFSYDAGPLKPEQVEIAVESCGICHSDLSMLQNEWGMTAYPFVPGHEIVGHIVATGDRVTQRKPGDFVGLGWFSESCMGCPQCLGGDHHLCRQNEQTMINRHGGFAERVRCHWAWATPLPAGVDGTQAGPLFCAGITVFTPIVEFGVKPTDRVGVVGVGGLGHLALQFLSKWGCHLTAFTSTAGKSDEARRFGAHDVVTSTDEGELKKLGGSLDFILVTANATLPWPLYLEALAPRGRLHFVGVVPEPIPTAVFPLLRGQRSISGSPSGSPATIARMLDFCSRHHLSPQVEFFPMSRAQDAMKHLAEGKPRYRIVLQNDLG